LYQLHDGRYVDLSKQLPRNIYAIMGWKAELKNAQKAHPEDKSQWPAPPELGDDLKQLCTDACRAVRYAITREPGSDKKIACVAQRVGDNLDALKEEYRRDETGAEI
jgi:hypothetical protein